jgi:hypothetical protein
MLRLRARATAGPGRFRHGHRWAVVTPGTGLAGGVASRALPPRVPPGAMATDHEDTAWRVDPRVSCWRAAGRLTLQACGVPPLG